MQLLSLYSMYLTLSPPARHSSSFTSLMCLPPAQARASFGDALSRAFTTEKSWKSARSADAPPAALAEADFGCETPQL